MLNKRKIKSLDFLEIILIQIFIMLICVIFYFISNYLQLNIFLYNSIVLLFIAITLVVAVIAIFQFVKMKYVQAVKVEVKVEMDNYKTKIDNKIIEENTRIGYFEVNYSKKLKKIMKDYLIKVKEIETCLIKIEKLDSEQTLPFYERIVKLNDIYPGICDEEVLKGIKASSKK